MVSFLATASERPLANDAPAQLISRDNALLRDRLRRYADAADSQRSDEIVATVTLVYNGVLSSLLRGTPDDPAARGRHTAATALGWTDLAGPAATTAPARNAKTQRT